VPQISVTVGVGLALASIAVLIYFIHHASTSIQAWNVISEVGEELDKAIDRLFPKKLGHSAQQQGWLVEEIPTNFDEQACPILSAGSGYLQAIDTDKLMQLAKSKNLLLRVKSRPGKFIVQGSELVKVWPGERVNKKLIKEIDKAFILGKQRTEQQDVEFCVNQLVEIAARAISPGINDPFTAIRCIDQLTIGLCHLAERDIPSPYRYDEDNKLRVIAEPITFAAITDAAFNQIRQYGLSDVAVMIRLLEAIAAIAPRTAHKKDRAVLLRHAQTIRRGSFEQVTEECDRKDIEEQYLAAVKALEQSG
jgi:uncharacterized membrane protein